ncbi:MAG: hypothetical protein M1823_002292 [Watsoniomyces obsoletus]|nr:MAG: hypothetical protein M1823_002292 [Watsoniomyces obsoletus]
MDSSDVRVRRKQIGGITKTTYHLPHFIHVAKTYPLLSPNGSTIIVYGHSDGIRVVWLGGRPFKNVPEETSHETSHEQPQPNGPENDAVVVIDSDEEPEEQQKPPERSRGTSGKKRSSRLPEPEFEDYDVEEDPSDPSASIVQYLDISLGNDVVDLSFPPFSANRSMLPSTLPTITSRLLIAVTACSDGSTRVVRVPLMPPSPAKKKQEESNPHTGDIPTHQWGIWGEKVLKLEQAAGHRGIPTKVAVTLTPFDLRVLSEEGWPPRDQRGGEGPLPDGSWPTREKEGAPGEKRLPPEFWQLLIATLLSGNTPTLLIYRVFVTPGRPERPERVAEVPLGMVGLAPIQIHHLSLPAMQISFNPSLYSPHRHSQLLLTDANGCVRIYDCRAKPSNATTAKMGPDENHGSWLMTLHPGFTSGTKTNHMSVHEAKRKQVLDAKWVLGGKSVVVLLSDSEWGIWDIEGAGPSVTRKGNLANQTARNGIRGGAITPWSLQGRVGPPVRAGNSPNVSSPNDDGPAKLMPRTPRSRKVQEQSLFAGSTTVSPSHHARGGIAVRPADPKATDMARHEAIVFWLDEHIAVLPDLWSYWENQVAKMTNGGLGNLLDPGAHHRLVPLEGVIGPYEMITDVDTMPTTTATTVDDSEGQQGNSPPLPIFPSILVAKHNDLVVVSRQTHQQPNGEVVQEETESTPRYAGSGPLGIDEINRSLASMGQLRDRPGRRKVTFATSG